MKIKINKYTLCICFFLFLKTAVIAGPPPPVGLPVGGSLPLLIAAAAIYGVFQLRKKE